MPTATVTSKGRVTLPVEIRRSLGIVRGTKLEFIHDEHGHLIIRTKARPTSDLASLLSQPADSVTSAATSSGTASDD